MCILCPLLSLQWEQMQQMEEKEAGALRGICTDFDYRADVKLWNAGHLRLNSFLLCKKTEF